MTTATTTLTLTELLICYACVLPVRRDAEEPRVYQCLKHHLTHVPLNPAQALDLVGLQSHSRHF